MIELDSSHLHIKHAVRQVDRPFGLERMRELTDELKHATALRNGRLRDWDDLKAETSQAKKNFEEAETEMLACVRRLTSGRELTERPVVITIDYREGTLTVTDDLDGEVYEERPLREDERQAELDLDVDETEASAPVPALAAGEPVEDAEFEEIEGALDPCDACCGTGKVDGVRCPECLGQAWIALDAEPALDDESAA